MSVDDPNRLNDLLQKPGTILLDGAGGRPGSKSLLFTHPIRILRADRLEEVEPLLASVEEATAQGHHVAGFLAYEAGYAFLRHRFTEFDGGFNLPGEAPLGWFGVYDAPEEVSPELIAASTASSSKLEQDDDFAPDLEAMESAEDFRQRVRDIRHLIREGDVYQVNHTTRFKAPFHGDPLDLFLTIRSRQPVAYGAFMNLGGLFVLSFSPELFFAIDGTSIEAEPMKGTAPRGETLAQDTSLSTWLAGDEKNRAENLMIVDLLRNDLSMVCRPGSVTVPERFAVSTYPSVHQMTSRVTGQLHEGIEVPALFHALFPCGSITGAPKIRSMRRIQALEAGPRGVYCGAIGYVSGSAAHRKACFSVAIRTAVLRRNELILGAGGGIIWDSDPEEEYEEMVLKTRFFSNRAAALPIQLIETMRWDAATHDVPLLRYHMDRLAHSASVLGFSWDRDSVTQAVTNWQPSNQNADWRLRLLMDDQGVVTLSATSLNMENMENMENMDNMEGTEASRRNEADAKPQPLAICLSSVRTSSSHPRYHHKTTDRGAYESAFTEARTRDCYDGLLMNERGEVTEGAITNIFVRKGGKWVTPPLSSGLLPGVGRQVFMLQNAVREDVLKPSDLELAEEIIVTNAIIGARKARFVRGNHPSTA